MIDDRFYRRLGPRRLDELALGAAIAGDPSRVVTSVASIAEAGPDDLAYFEGASPPDAAAAGILIARDLWRADRDQILAKRPRAHFAVAARLLAEERSIAPDAPLRAASAQLEEGVALGPGVVIGEAAQIGAGTAIGANAVIGPGVAIGRRCRIGPNTTIFCALIGDDVVILPGAAIGQAGFGVAADAEGPIDVPHFGRVIIQDGATLGANSTVDRGVFGDTVIAERAKIDNLCHVAHNVTIGRGAIMAAFAGISGSVTIGDGVMMGGRVGVADHLSVGRGAVLAAGSAVLQDVPAGQTWAGYPARPIRQWLRQTAWLVRAVGKRDGGSN